MVNASKINLVNYNVRNYLATGSQNITNKEFTFQKTGCVIVSVRTQQTPGTGFIRINSSADILYEANGLTGSYRYLWSPPIYVSANTSLIISAEVEGSNVTDAQISVIFYS